MLSHINLVLLFSTLILISCNQEKTAQLESFELKKPSEERSPKSNPYFIHLSDIHLDASSGYVDYGEDTDTTLWTITMNKLTEIMSQSPPPSFVIYTGDLAAHYGTHFLAPSHRADHNKNLRVLLNDLRELVNNNGIPFFYLPGNNDALAGDYYSFADGQQQTPFSLVPDVRNPFPALNTSDQCGDPPCIVSDAHPSFGFYSARPMDNLKVITLNSVILGKDYKEVDGVSHLDAGNIQMKWLYDELKSARDSSDKVIIAMHIPPGNDAYAVHKNRPEVNFWAHRPSRQNSWLNQFIQYTHSFKPEIVGILYGHTHMDEVRRIFNDTSNNVSNLTEVAISAPGITPQHYNNPGFKTISFDSKSKELLDFETYYTTPQATAYGNLSYRFSDEFDCGEGVTIFDCLKSMSDAQLNTEMDSIFKVKNGVARSGSSIGGISVLIGQ